MDGCWTHPDSSFKQVIKSRPNELLVFTVIICIHCPRYQDLDSAKVMKRGGVYWIESSRISLVFKVSVQCPVTWFMCFGCLLCFVF